MPSYCALCDSKNSRFIKEQGVNGLLHRLGIRKPSRQISLISPLLF